jgi:hypothetical protein
MFPLTVTLLRFVCEALTPIRLARYEAGSRLRGALGQVMRRAYCAHVTPTPGPSPEMKQRISGEGSTGCPVCWLLAANEHPGEERRGYALRPMLDPPEVYQPGQRFQFGLTLFGDAQRFLPYFILAVPEVGREGVGAGRGRFALRQVWADDPLSGQTLPVLAEGESLVHVPASLVDQARVTEAANRLADAIGPDGRLSLAFLTPMRLIEAEALLKVPDFSVLFARLLHRLDDLNRQFAGGQRRAEGERLALQALADRVRLLSAETEWLEVWSGSSRTHDRTPIGGFVGRATYSAPIDVWQLVLPWLIWGQSVQVGKDVVKGNGVYVIQKHEG